MSFCIALTLAKRHSHLICHLKIAKGVGELIHLYREFLMVHQDGLHLFMGPFSLLLTNAVVQIQLNV